MFCSVHRCITAGGTACLRPVRLDFTRVYVHIERKINNLISVCSLLWHGGEQQRWGEAGLLRHHYQKMIVYGRLHGAVWPARALRLQIYPPWDLCLGPVIVCGVRFYRFVTSSCKLKGYTQEKLCGYNPFRPRGAGASVCVYANELCCSLDVIGCPALASEEVIGSTFQSQHTFRGRITKAGLWSFGRLCDVEQRPLASCCVYSIAWRISAFCVRATLFNSVLN